MSEPFASLFVAQDGRRGKLTVNMREKKHSRGRRPNKWQNNKRQTNKQATQKTNELLGESRCLCTRFVCKGRTVKPTRTTTTIGVPPKGREWSAIRVIRGATLKLSQKPSNCADDGQNFKNFTRRVKLENIISYHITEKNHRLSYEDTQTNWSSTFESTSFSVLIWTRASGIVPSVREWAG